MAAATLAVSAESLRIRDAGAPRARDISCVPFRSARPSFAARISGSSPTSRRATSAGITWPCSSTWPRPISGSARCASGARSPDAPTDPWAGTTGWTPRSRNARSRSTTSGGSRYGRARACSPAAASIARTTSRGQSAPDARSVAHQEVLLEPRGVGRRDEPRREVAEPGRDAVHDLAALDEPSITALDACIRSRAAASSVALRPSRATASTSAIVRSAPVSTSGWLTLGRFVESRWAG